MSESFPCRDCLRIDFCYHTSKFVQCKDLNIYIQNKSEKLDTNQIGNLLMIEVRNVSKKIGNSCKGCLSLLNFKLDVNLSNYYCNCYDSIKWGVMSVIDNNEYRIVDKSLNLIVNCPCRECLVKTMCKSKNKVTTKTFLPVITLRPARVETFTECKMLYNQIKKYKVSIPGLILEHKSY